MTEAEQRQAAAVGVGAFVGTLLAENLMEQPSMGGGGTTSIDLTPVTDALQQILSELQMIQTAITNTQNPGGGGTLDQTILQNIQTDLDLMIQRNQVTASIDVITLTAGAAVQQLYANPMQVRRALIQNISTDPVTLFTHTGTSNGIRGSAGKGIILNAASGSGTGGGSLPVLNEDLSNYFFVAATTADLLAVWKEI